MIFCTQLNLDRCPVAVHSRNRMTGYFEKVFAALRDPSVRKATCYISPTEVITATRPHKLDKRSKSHSILLTMGRPNFRGRMFVKACQKAGEPFPVKKIQIKHWPK